MDLEGLDDVTDLDIVIVLNGDAAFVAAADFSCVILEALQGTKPAAVDNDAVADQPDASEISDSFIRDIEKYGSVGDEIKVKILSIDKENGFLRVSYKQVPPEEAYSTHSNQRKLPSVTEEEFLPLKEKLDDWINEAYQQIEKEEK